MRDSRSRCDRDEQDVAVDGDRELLRRGDHARDLIPRHPVQRERDLAGDLVGHDEVHVAGIGEQALSAAGSKL